eukprot:TRINITY_DN25052_c0_g3_i1.p1 TRINITY_DN25052_c0_g3~~TRINITY_DN25052_c0_g3_i1.p1  ORF type:complete len:415 (-),score=26.63 TRINITY_DN25052_c0_g3_i1:260-1504(-)
MTSIGAFLLVRYAVAGPEIWHERLVLWVDPAGGPGKQIFTPDGDRYEEDIAAGVADLLGFHFLNHQGQLHPGVQEDRCYRFRGLPSYMRYRDLVAEAHAEAAHPVPAIIPNMKIGPLGDGGGAAAAGAVVPAGDIGLGIPPGLGGAVPPAPLNWVFAESHGRAVRGDDVAAEDVRAATLLGRRGIVLVDHRHVVIVHRDDLAALSGSGDDLRTLPVRFDPQGERRRELSDALSLMSDELPAGGMPLQGPRSVLWTLTFCRDSGGSAANAHELWVRNGNIPGSDRSVYEHECLSRILDAAVLVDQLNAPSLLSMELIVRRMALIKEAHRVSPSAPDYSMSDQFMGWTGRRGAAGVNPELSRHVADELLSQAMVAKEARKAREERHLRARGRGDGRGRGRGGGGGGGPDGAAAAAQ